MTIFRLLLNCFVAAQCLFIGNGIELHYCKPGRTIISVGSPYFNFFPYFAELHRCIGSCSAVSPRIQACTAATTKMVSKTFFDLSRNSEPKVFQLVNHTSCKCTCAQVSRSCTELQVWKPESCSCDCKYGAINPYIKGCPVNFKWNQGACKCLCDLSPTACSSTQQWNSDYCGCLCTIEAFKRCALQNLQMDKDTCTCYSQQPGSPNSGARGTESQGRGISSGVLIGCMFVELVLLLLLFEMFLFCHYGEGFIVGRVFCRNKTQDLHNKKTSINEKSFWSRDEMI